MYDLTPETGDDYWEVEALFDLCFAPGREALSSYRLRDGVPAVADLSVVARDIDGILGAAVRFWPVMVREHQALLLGPIAVHPTRQGEGLGGQLMRHVMAKAQVLGWQRVLLVGDYPYYSRFGFEKLEGVLMPPPTNPARILGYALQPGAWDAVSGDVDKMPA